MYEPYFGMKNAEWKTRSLVCSPSILDMVELEKELRKFGWRPNHRGAEVGRTLPTRPGRMRAHKADEHLRIEEHEYVRVAQ